MQINNKNDWVDILFNNRSNKSNYIYCSVDYNKNRISLCLSSIIKEGMQFVIGANKMFNFNEKDITKERLFDRLTFLEEIISTFGIVRKGETKELTFI
jgi:hypothetical protein